MDQPNDRPRTFSEEIDVAGGQLVERVKALLTEGNVRRIRIKSEGGALILDLPLTVGAIAGGAVVLAAPWLAVIGAFAALVTHARIEVVREEAGPGSKDPPGDQARV
jgi:hypothetical protein